MTQAGESVDVSAKQSFRISTIASSHCRLCSHSHAQKPHISAAMVKYVVTGSTGGLGSQVFKYLIRLVPGTSSLFQLCISQG